MEDESRKALEGQLAEQSRLLLKEQEKPEELIRLLGNQQKEVEELRFLGPVPGRNL